MKRVGLKKEIENDLHDKFYNLVIGSNPNVKLYGAGRKRLFLMWNRINHSLKKQIENDLHDVFHNVLMRSTNRHKVQVRILPPKIEGAVTDIKEFIWDQIEEEICFETKNTK